MVFDEDETKDILKFFFKNDHDLIDSITIDDKIRSFAQKIRKLAIARQGILELNNAIDDLQEVTGDEETAKIIGLAENRILDYSRTCINSSDLEVINDDIIEYVNYLKENQVDQVGISTGYPILDKYIGQGLRHGVYTIAARSGVGKSSVGINIALHLNTIDVPVLYMDTEMDGYIHKSRLLARGSGVPINKIETGQFANTGFENQLIDEFAKKLKEKRNYFYKAAGDMSFGEQISTIRRFYLQEVKAGNPCVIFYDYIHATDPSMLNHMQEYQLFGFQMVELQNLARKYQFPIVAFVQLNQENKTAQSDRILWKSSGLAKFALKSPEELGTCPEEYGSHKMWVEKARFAPPMVYNDYINYSFDGSICKIVEKDTALNIQRMNG